MWKRCKEAGDMYFEANEGWYLVCRELCVTNTEAKEWDFKDTGSGVPLKKVKIKLFLPALKVPGKVLELIEEDHGAFIQPEQQIIKWFSNDEVRDLSIGHWTFDHSVPVGRRQ